MFEKIRLWHVVFNSFKFYLMLGNLKIYQILKLKNHAAMIQHMPNICFRRLTCVAVPDYSQVWSKALSIKALKSFMNRETNKVLDRNIPPGYSSKSFTINEWNNCCYICTKGCSWATKWTSVRMFLKLSAPIAKSSEWVTAWIAAVVIWSAFWQ